MLRSWTPRPCRNRIRCCSSRSRARSRPSTTTIRNQLGLQLVSRVAIGRLGARWDHWPWAGGNCSPTADRSITITCTALLITSRPNSFLIVVRRRPDPDHEDHSMQGSTNSKSSISIACCSANCRRPVHSNCTPAITTGTLQLCLRIRWDRYHQQHVRQNLHVVVSFTWLMCSCACGTAESRGQSQSSVNRRHVPVAGLQI